MRPLREHLFRRPAGRRSCGRRPIGRWLAALLSANVSLSLGAAEAQRPACVDISLPEPLPQPDTWRTLLVQETRPLLASEGDECAKVEISTERDDSLPTLQVSWRGAARSLPLVLEELPEQERARATALLTRGMLQQVIDQQEREALDAVDSGAPDSAPSDPAEGGPKPKVQARADAPPPTGGTASQLTPPQLPNSSKHRRKSRWDDYNWAWQPDEAARIAAARNDRFMGTARMRRGSPWSGFANVGSTFGLTGSTSLIQFEVGAQRLLASRRVRFGVGVLGLFAPTSASTGGPGLRGCMDVRLLNYPHARVWLGPGFNFAEMVVNGESESNGAPYRVVEPVASADARATVDFALNGHAYFSLALEFAYALRYLEVVSEELTLFSYAGPMLGVRFGVGF